MDAHAGFPSWEQWLQKTQVTGVDISRGLRINNSAAVLQAAIEGRGVALARSVMAHDDLAAGRLVRLYPDIRAESALAYYVVYHNECASLPRLAAFRDWLMQEAALQGNLMCKSDVKMDVANKTFIAPNRPP